MPEGVNAVFGLSVACLLLFSASALHLFYKRFSKNEVMRKIIPMLSTEKSSGNDFISNNIVSNNVVSYLCA